MVFVNEPLIFPPPLAAMPVTAALLSLVQVYVVDGTLLLKAIVVMAAPEHIVCDDGVAIASGLGFTNTVAVVGVPIQPFAVGVMVNVTFIGAKVVLVNVPLIFPLPLAAIPVTVPVLFLVHV